MLSLLNVNVALVLFLATLITPFYLLFILYHTYSYNTILFYKIIIIVKVIFIFYTILIHKKYRGDDMNNCLSQEVVINKKINYLTWIKFKLLVSIKGNDIKFHLNKAIENYIDDFELKNDIKILETSK
jgi:hypothetical protein